MFPTRPLFSTLILTLMITGILTQAQAQMHRLRIGVFNIRELSTEILVNADEKGVGRDSQAIAAAEIIQRIRPDVLLICEIDHDYTTPGLPLDTNARRFINHYLKHGAEPIDYPHVYAAPNNTGILSGVDLDGNGQVATPADQGKQVYADDCWGWGMYPGQYSMALLSRVPLDTAAARTFQLFKWKDLPGHHIPMEYYPQESIDVFRLSSKSHWDVPITVGGRTIHLLACHPTPQGFDGPEDRNGRRNFDELRLWRLYLENSPAIVDDAGKAGGLPAEASFLIFGDLNASEADKKVYDNMRPIDQLITHPRVQDTGAVVVSEGAVSFRAAGPPLHPERHTIGHRNSTRLDYILPSTDLKVTGGGSYWPDPRKDLVGNMLSNHASDHRMIWVDLEWGG